MTENHIDDLCRTTGTGRSLVYIMDICSNKALTRFEGQISTYARDKPASVTRNDNIQNYADLLGSGDSSSNNEKDEIEDNIGNLDAIIRNLNSKFETASNRCKEINQHIGSLKAMRKEIQTKRNLPKIKKSE